MTVIERTFAAVPARSASETWRAVIDLIAPSGADARKELESITGIASSLITREAMKSAPIVMHGSGPQLRIYCIYGDDAITADDANENKLAFNPTEGDWAISLPCPEEEMEWVQSALSQKTKKVTARNQEEKFDTDKEEKSAGTQATVDTEAFFRL
jgi:hypothetical protein